MLNKDIQLQNVLQLNNFDVNLTFVTRQTKDLNLLCYILS